MSEVRVCGIVGSADKECKASKRKFKSRKYLRKQEMGLMRSILTRVHCWADIQMEFLLIFFSFFFGPVHEL